jgi:hypothetical protein
VRLIQFGGDAELGHLERAEDRTSCLGKSVTCFVRGRAVLATWVIRSGNRHFENDIPFLYRLQRKEGESKIGSRKYSLMLERRQSLAMEKLIL